MISTTGIFGPARIRRLQAISLANSSSAQFSVPTPAFNAAPSEAICDALRVLKISDPVSRPPQNLLAIPASAIAAHRAAWRVLNYLDCRLVVQLVRALS
jgi:hypothetical protein